MNPTDANSKSEQQYNRARCVISQNIIIVIVVMATMIFVLVVISTVLAITTYRKKRRIQILKNKQSLDCNYRHRTKTNKTQK
jgi:heme/copper-type cytochrome/quinol oxidase subunit 2